MKEDKTNNSGSYGLSFPVASIGIYFPNTWTTERNYPNSLKYLFRSLDSVNHQ